MRASASPAPVAADAAVPHGRGYLRARLASWRYTGDQRDLRFDLLRGFAVFAMIVDHIGGSSSWLYRFTGEDHFYTSAAEAFVFISGLVFGIVYLQVIRRRGLAEAILKALRRAGTLYVLTVSLTFVTAFLAYQFRLPWAPKADAASLREFALGTITFHHAYYLTDVLLLYTLLLVGAALSLALLATGRTWLILAASWGVWLLWQVDARYGNFLWPIEGNEVFFLPAWQVLFFTGIALGYHRQTLARRFGWLTGPWALVVSFILLRGLIYLYGNGLSLLPFGELMRVQNAFLFKPNVGAGRLVAFAIVITFAVSFLTTFWRPLSRASGWLLLPLGQHALAAYGLHLFVIVATTKLAPRWFGASPTAPQTTALQVGGIAAIWAAIVVRRVGMEWIRRLPRPSMARVGSAQPR